MPVQVVDHPPIPLQKNAVYALGSIKPGAPRALSENIVTLLKQDEIAQDERKDIHERMTVQISVDTEVIKSREKIGKIVGTVIAVTLLAVLYFAVPAIAGSVWLLFLTAFIITLMSVGILFIVMNTLNKVELARTHVLSEFLEAMPTPR